MAAAATQREHVEGAWLRALPRAGSAAGFSRPCRPGLSSSTNVVATQVAVIVEFGSGLSLPSTSSALMFTMRVNLPTRSKKIARLWYVPSSSSAIGHSAWSCLVTVGAA